MSELGGVSLKDIGIGVAAILILVAGYREMWVWGYLYRREVERANRLEAMVYQLMGVTRKLVDKEKQEMQ